MSNSIVSWSQVLLLLLVSSSALADAYGNAGLTVYEAKHDETVLNGDADGAGAVRSLLKKKKKKCPKCQFDGQICGSTTGFVCKCRGQLQPKTIKKETIIKKKKKTVIKKTTIKKCACLAGKQVGFACVLPKPSTPALTASPSPVVG